MKRQQIIKDKDKLFQKLFISPSYCQPLDPPLLVSPDFINLLLQQSIHASKQYQFQLINDLLNVFAQRPTNSLILCAHDKGKLEVEKSILDYIVQRLLMLISTQEQVQLYLERVILVLSYYRITLRNLKKLMQWLSKKAFLQKFDPIKYMFIIRLIKLYYGRKLGQLKAPSYYFYIYGAQNCGIQPVQHTINQFAFKNQLTITLSFNSQGKQTKSFNLCLIKTQKKQQIGLTYSKGTLKVTSLCDGEYLDQYLFVKQLSEQVWYRIIINLNNSQTECILDSQSYKGKALLKKQRQRKITACVFGRQFFGMIGSIMVSNKNLGLQKFQTSTYPYGIDSLTHLKYLNKTNIPMTIICSCLPFFTFQVRQTMHCFDLFRRNHSSISDNIIIVGQKISQDYIQHLGGFDIFLPLFYLARFYNKNLYPSILEDLLKIILEIFNCYSIQKIQKQLEEGHFLQILGQHLSDIPHLQTQKSLNIIFNIYKKLKKQKNKQIFIHDIFWSLNIGIQVPNVLNYTKQQYFSTQQYNQKNILINSDSFSPTRIYKDQIDQLISQYYKKLLMICEIDVNLAYKSMSLAQIIYWAVQHLQNNQNMSFTCCLQHHLNQSILSSQMSVQQLIKLDYSHVKTHYCYIQEIITIYLENLIKNSDQTIIQQLKTLLRLFLQKYSACFYLTILHSIKRQIVSKFNQKLISKIITDPKLQIISFLVFLSQKTINPDIISEIIFISLYVQKYSNQKKKQQVLKFIVNLLKINQSIQASSINPIRVLVKKIRKSSKDFQNQTRNGDIQISRKRRNTICDFKGRKITKNIEQHRLSRIISRTPRPQKISAYPSIYNIIVNQLSGQVSDKQLILQNINYQEDSIIILKQYYKIAQPLFKQNLLLFMLLSLQKNPHLKKTGSLIMFFLQCLKQSINKSPKQTKSLVTIFTCIFSQIISHHESIVNFYSSIKFLKPSRAAVSLILPNVLSKVIKLIEFSQLQDLLMISLYQIMETTGQSALDLSQIVLLQFHNQLLKNTQKNKKIIQQNKVQQFLSRIICKKADKNYKIFFQDPFLSVNQSVCQQKNNLLTKNQTQPNINEKKENVDNQNSIKQQKDWNNYKKDKQNIQSKTLEKNFYHYQLTVIQIYLKLFFKVISRISNKNLSQIPSKESMIRLQNQSVLSKCRNSQIGYSFEYKSKQLLIKQFTQIIGLIINKIADKSFQTNKYNVKFILSYIIYKIYNFCKVEQEKLIDIQQLLRQICVIASRPLIILQSSFIQETYISQQNQNQMGFLQFFCHMPFELNKNQISNIKESKQEFQKYFTNQFIQKIFDDEKYTKFFTNIQDLHDLLIVGYYQKNMQNYVEEYQNIMSYFSSDKSFRNIQKLFDVQNNAEQKTRISFLYENQCKFRKYHYQWDNLWNKLRTYHQPYGFWMAQKYKDSVYCYKKNQIRNFKFQISEYSSSSGLNPILQAKIIQPWVIIKDNRIKKNKYINSFSEMMKPSHINTQKTETKNNVLANMWRGMLGLNKKKNSYKVHEYEVVLICRSTKAAGKLFIQNKQDLIFCYEGARQEDTHLSFQKFSLAYNRQTYQKWPIYNIEKVKIHRYLLRYEALQIIFSDSRSIIFDFVNYDKDQFIKQLQKIQKQKMQNTNPKLYKLNKIHFFQQSFYDLKLFDMKITQSWVKRQISNLQYLIKLNKCASRGIYDLSQYSVVPWVVEFKKQKQPKFRDLSKTMGALGSQERKKIIAQKYYTKDPFNPYPPFFFGTHYSSPGVVFNLLIRLSPFTEYCKHLQGGKFDIPDRLFSSLVGAWRSASEQVSDVRQLIPEIYYLPEILLNVDQNYFGYTQNNQLINNVQIPPWGANNPYFFISQLRQLMESEEVSQRLCEWIDLIFGYKQKGKEAQQNYNVYYYLTYEDSIQINQEQDDVYKKSKEAQIVHFGQIPPMLFDKPHPTRNKPEFDSIYQLKIIKTINLMNSLKQKPIGLKILNNQLIICKRNQLQIYSAQSDIATLQKKKKINFEKSISQTYYIIKKQKSNVIFFQKPYFIVWGYFSNQFRIFNKNTGEIAQEDGLQSKITSLLISKAQDLIFIGMQAGLLAVYEIQYGINEIFIKKIGKQCFPASVVHLSEYDGYFCITFGNYSSIYKIQRTLHYIGSSQSKASIKFFRSFYNSLPLKASYLMCSPLYTIILIDNANIKSYSINGQLIKTINNSAKHYGRFKDYQLHDVFYAIDEDTVICLSVPDLRNISILELPYYEHIMDQYVIRKQSIQQIGYRPV